MIFFTKLTKRKKSNSSAFTLLELLVVIVVIGIIAGSFSFNFAPDKLKLATDQLIRDLEYTQSLAIKDDKYKPFPNQSSNIDKLESKYWFKRWWQLKFAKDGNNIIYLVFSDRATTTTSNFDEKVIQSSHTTELAKDFYGKYIYGGDTYLYANEEPNQDYNLSRRGIKQVKLESQYGTDYNGSIHILFDNYGNVFLDEGITGDSGDINPLQTVRKQLTKPALLKLCKDYACNDYCSIKIFPSGTVVKYRCTTN